MDAGPLLLLRRQSPEVELMLELDSKLSGLRPSNEAADGADPDNVDGDGLTRRDGQVALDQGTHRGNVPQPHFDSRIAD